MDFILWLQGLTSPQIENFFGVLFYLSSFYTYGIGILLTFTSIDKKLAFRLLVTLLLSFAVNLLLKKFFQVERPYTVDIRVITRFAESTIGYSCPSVHVQIAVTFYAFLYFYFKKNYIISIGGILSILISLSRIYFGVNWIGDTILAIVVGILIAFISDIFLNQDRFLERKRVANEIAEKIKLEAQLEEERVKREKLERAKEISSSDVDMRFDPELIEKLKNRGQASQEDEENPF